MGAEGQTIGRTVAGAGLTVAGIATSNPQLAFFGGSQFLQGANRWVFGRRGEGRDVTPDSSTERALPVAYGRTVVPGSVIDAREVSDDSENLWVVFAFCHGGTKGPNGTPDGDISAFNWLYAPQEHNITQIKLWSPAGGIDDDFTVGVDKVNTHKGAFDQSADSDLTSTYSDWTSDHAGQGVVYAAIKFKWDEQVWGGHGIPNIRADIDGNVVYDPRDGNWKHSSNPALCILDYLTSDVYGMGANYPGRDNDGSVSEINEQSFKDMADFCDDQVTVNFHDGSDKTRTRFLCNGWLDTSNDPAENLQQLLTSCRGEVIYQEGEFRLHIPRDKNTTTFSLDESNIIGDWTWKRGGVDSVPNKVRASYYEDITVNLSSMTDVVWPDPEDQNPYLQSDNGYENVREIELPFSTTPDDSDSPKDLAESIAMIGLKEARQDTEVEVTARESALQLEVGDVVPLTHETPAWEDKPFWVRVISYLPEQNAVRLNLKEFDSEAYSLDEMKKASGPPGTNLPNTLDVDEPSNFNVSTGSSNAIEGPGGERIPKAFITWDDPAKKKFLDFYVIQFKESSSSNWKTVKEPDRGVQSHDGPVIKNGVDYDFRIKAVNVVGYSSNWVTVNNHTATATGTQNPIIIADHKEIDNDGDGSVDTGEATFTVFDPGGSDLHVEVNTKKGRSSSFTEVYDNKTFSSGDSVTEQVSLQEKVLSYIECEATSNESGNDQNEILVFDPNKIPNFEVFDGYIRDNGEVTWIVSGDTDTDSIRVEIDYNGDGTFTETRDSNNREFTGTSNSKVNRTDDAQIKATLYSEDGQSGTTKSDTIDVHRIGDQVVEVDPTEDRAAGTYTLDFTLLREGNFTVQVKDKIGSGSTFNTYSGDEGNLSGIGATDSFTSPNNTLQEGLTTRVVVLVTDDESNNKEVQKETITFDPDDTPDHQGHTLSVDEDGSASLELQGDSDANSWKYDYNVGDSPSAPSKSTVDGVGAGQTVDGRTATVSDFATLSEGQTVAVSVVGYAETDGAGTSSKKKWSDKRTYRDTGASSGTSNRPTAEISYRPHLSNKNKITFEVDGTVGEEGSSYSNLEGRHQKVADGTVDSTAWSSWQSVSYTKSYTSWNAQDMFVVEVRDTGVSGNPKDRRAKPFSEIDSLVDQAPGVTASTSKPDDGTTTGDGADAGDEEEGHIYAVYS